MLPDGSGRTEQNLGKKTDQEKPHVQTARIIAFIEHRWDNTVDCYNQGICGRNKAQAPYRP
jgi:hypothetical protein